MREYIPGIITVVVLLAFVAFIVVIAIRSGNDAETFMKGYRVDTYVDKDTEQEYLIVISDKGGVTITPRIK